MQKISYQNLQTGIEKKIIEATIQIITLRAVQGRI